MPLAISERQNDLGLQPANGDYVDDWNVPVNDDWAVIDSCFNSVMTVTLSDVDVDLTTTQLQCFYLKFNGTLTADVTVTIPAGVGGLFQVEDTTSGDYTVTLVSAGAGKYVVLSKNAPVLISCDATDVINAGMPSGTVLPFFMASAPAGWTQNVTYNDYTLRIVSGNSGGSATGSVGLSTFLSDGTSNTTLTAAQVPSLTYAVNDPGHVHGVSGGIYGGTEPYGLQGGSSYSVANVAPITIEKAITGISVSSNAGGGAHNHGFLALQYLDFILATKN